MRLDSDAPGGVFGGFQYLTVPLEPLNGLQVRSMLDNDEDLEALLSRVAASSRLVQEPSCDLRGRTHPRPSGMATPRERRPGELRPARDEGAVGGASARA